MNRKASHNPPPNADTSPTGSPRHLAPPRSPITNSFENAYVEENVEEVWRERFTEVFGLAAGEAYGRAFAKACMIPDRPCLLSDWHLHEMRIPVGHRQTIQEMLERLQTIHSTQVSTNADDDDHGEQLRRMRSASSMRFMAHTRMILMSGLKWYDYEGEVGDYDSFVTFVEATIIRKGSSEELPEHFIRAFWNNKPMPYSASSRTKGGRPCAILLLRLPSTELVNDPLHVKDSTMATMTNRMIFVYLPRGAKAGTLITYHKDPTSTMPWLDEVKNEAWDRMERMPREKFFLHLLSESLGSSQEILDCYRKQLDALIDVRVSKSPTAVVEWMNLIARQAQVLKRCLFGDKTAVSELCEALALEGQATLQILSDLSVVAGEIECNATDAMQLRMGLVGFRAQENMKLFTYVSAVTAPLAVLTGWYGMNFEHMPELGHEESYPVIAGFAVCVTIFIVGVIWWKNRGEDIDRSLHDMVAQDLKDLEGTTLSVMKHKSMIEMVPIFPSPSHVTPVESQRLGHGNIVEVGDMVSSPRNESAT